LKQQELFRVKAEYKELKQKFLKSLQGKAEPTEVDTMQYKKLEKILDFHRCPMCFKLIPDEEVYVTEHYMGLATRWHPKCLEERNIRANEAQARYEKLKARLRRMREEIEANKRKGTWTVFWTVTGYKKDYERLMKDLPNILKQYDLEPWKKVRRKH